MLIGLETKSGKIKMYGPKLKKNQNGGTKSAFTPTKIDMSMIWLDQLIYVTNFNAIWWPTWQWVWKNGLN